MCTTRCVDCMKCMDEQELDDFLETLEKKRADEERYFTTSNDNKNNFQPAHF